MLLGCIESNSPVAAAFTKSLLLRGAAADTWAPSGLSALMIAAAANKTDIMELLITNRGPATASGNGASARSSSGSAHTAAAPAAEPASCSGKAASATAGHAPSCAARCGGLPDCADISLPDAQKRTALMHAASGDHIEAIELLLAHGADVRCWSLPCFDLCADAESALHRLRAGTHMCYFALMGKHMWPSASSCRQERLYLGL